MSIGSLPNSHQHTFSFLTPNHWIFEKFCYPSSHTSFIDLSKNPYNLFAFYEILRNSGQGKYKIAMQWIFPQLIETKNEKIEIQEQIRSTQSLLFIIHNEHSLKDQKKEFYSFIKLHENINNSIPLCILNATNLSNQQMYKVLEIQEKLENYNHISYWSIQNIVVDEFCRIFNQEAENSLCDSLTWLANKLNPQPNLSGAYLRDLIECYYDDRMLSLFDDDQLKIQPNRRPHPNIITKMFRQAINFTYHTIISNSDSSLDWPIQEFVRENYSNTNHLLPSDFDFDPGNFIFYLFILIIFHLTRIF